MIAVDTNILVYSHRQDSPWHGRASDLVRRLAEGSSVWAIPWPCVHEFYSIVTNPRIYRPASTVVQAVQQVDAWLGSPGLQLLAETDGYYQMLRGLLGPGQIAGAQVHDARVAALCLHHGIRELWSADRDFSRFSRLSTRNPLIN